MTTAVIGLGAIGSAVARHLANGGASITVAERDQSKAHSFAVSLGERANAADVATAIAKSDVVIMAVWLDGVRDLVREYGADLAGKIVVDPSNPIKPDGKGGFVKTIPQDQSSGQLLARLLPPGTKLVKAFGTLRAESLAKASSATPRSALFYAADDEAAGSKVADLITTAGFAPVKVGGLDQSIRLEVFGDLHEFGGLGHVPTQSEAEALVKLRQG